MLKDPSFQKNVYNSTWREQIEESIRFKWNSDALGKVSSLVSVRYDMNLDHGSTLKYDRSAWTSFRSTSKLIPGQVNDFHFELIQYTYNTQANRWLIDAGIETNEFPFSNQKEKSYLVGFGRMKGAGLLLETGTLFQGTRQSVYYENGPKNTDQSLFQTGDVIGVRVDMRDLDNFTVEFFKNGTSLGKADKKLSAEFEYYPAISLFGVHTIKVGWTLGASCK
jgi:hypothetical protein